MAAAGVWWVENKIAQVTNTVNGAVASVKETVDAPFKAMDGAYDTFNTNALHAVDATKEAYDSVAAPIEQNFFEPLREALGVNAFFDSLRD